MFINALRSIRDNDAHSPDAESWLLSDQAALYLDALGVDIDMCRVIENVKTGRAQFTRASFK